MRYNDHSLAVIFEWSTLMDLRGKLRFLCSDDTEWFRGSDTIGMWGWSPPGQIARFRLHNYQKPNHSHHLICLIWCPRIASSFPIRFNDITPDSRGDCLRMWVSQNSYFNHRAIWQRIMGLKSSIDQISLNRRTSPPQTGEWLRKNELVFTSSCKRRLPRWLFQDALKCPWPLEEVNPDPWIHILTEAARCNRRDRNQRVPDRVSIGDARWKTLLIAFCCMNCSVTVAVWGWALSAWTHSFRLVLPTLVLGQSDSGSRIWVT
jgi:hypothetical protein